MWHSWKITLKWMSMRLLRYVCGDDSENKLEGDYMMTDILNMKDCDLNKG